MTSYRFGFLGKKVSYQFTGGTVAPVADFDQAHVYIVQRTHSDGFVYPPILTRPAVAELGPRLERAAHLYRLPASHELRLDHDPRPDDRERSGENFLIHLLAFLHGSMFQFEDWCHDARVAIHGQHNVHFTHSTAEHFISHAYHRWRAWPAGTQRRFTNVLFMLNRAPSYEWDWEHFIIEYTVLDACYRTATDLGLVQPGGGHRDRIDRLAAAFSLQIDRSLVDTIVRLRNDLLHESLWDSCRPGTAKTQSSFFAPLHLRRFNQRLVLALLGYHNDYMRTAWWYLGTHRFNQPP